MEMALMDIFNYFFTWKSVLALVLLWFLFTSIFIVRGKTAGILETFGKPHERARMPGLHFKMPWPITSVRAFVNTQQQEIKADVTVKTSDNAFMTMPVKVQYRASDDPVSAVKAHYELDEPKVQITSYILNNVRQTASGMAMADLYANRDSMEVQVQTSLSAQFARYGYIIENVLVDQPQPTPEVSDAFNRVIASKRLMEAAENEAAAARVKLIGVAEAESRSKELQGQGMARMREEMAKGLETAMGTMKKAGLTTQEAIAFLNETNRLDTISNASAHGNMIIVDTRSSDNVINTVTAVKAASTEVSRVTGLKAA